MNRVTDSLPGDSTARLAERLTAGGVRRVVSVFPRRMHARLFVSLVLFVASTLVNFGAGNPARPNVIFILADDLGYGDIGAFGQKLIKTPHIDQLAVEGTNFTQAYAGE